MSSFQRFRPAFHIGPRVILSLYTLGCLFWISPSSLAGGQQVGPPGALPQDNPTSSAQETAGRPGAEAAGANASLVESIRDYVQQRAASWNEGDIDGFFKSYSGPYQLRYLYTPDETKLKELAKRFEERYRERPESLGKLDIFGVRTFEMASGTEVIGATWRLTRGSTETHGDWIIGLRPEDDEWRITRNLGALCSDLLGSEPEFEFGWWSVIPPLLAIFLAIITRRVLISLFYGVLVGCAMLAGADGVMTLPQMGQWILDTLYVLGEKQLWPVLVDEEKQRILWFVVLMGGMVGVIHRSGGMHGIVNLLTPLAKTRVGGQIVTWLLGLIIFFDDYANTLLLGNTLRPVTDRLKISREKLAYLVDSTAAPVAGLAVISTWIAMLISEVDAGFKIVDRDVAESIDYNAFWLVLQSIPYRFYIIFAILFVPMVGFLGRDFGPMLAAEERTLAGEPPEDVVEVEGAASYDVPQRWYNAVIPIVVLVGTTVLFLITTGMHAVQESRHAVQESDKLEMTAFNIMSMGNSYVALVYGSLLGLIAALGLAGLQKTLSGRQLFTATWDGIKTVVPAMAILWLAWTLSNLTDSSNLGTQDYLASLLTVTEQPDWCPNWLFIMYQNITSVRWLPTAVFILASFVAFATGSSWGTMGIMAPLVITVTYQLATLQLGECPPDDPLMLASIASVISGSIFGDHCSPISDTTVLSSQSSGCPHIAHVRTQIPYAVTVGIISIIFGTLPVGYFSYLGLNLPLWLFLILGVVSMLAVLLIFGRRPPEPGSEPGKVG